MLNNFELIIISLNSTVQKQDFTWNIGTLNHLEVFAQKWLFFTTLGRASPETANNFDTLGKEESQRTYGEHFRHKNRKSMRILFPVCQIESLLKRGVQSWLKIFCLTLNMSSEFGKCISDILYCFILVFICDWQLGLVGWTCKRNDPWLFGFWCLLSGTSHNLIIAIWI